MQAKHTHHSAGFTIFEVLLAVVLAMILMFGALYSTSESYNVAREADKRLHTHISARKSLDTMLKQIRYSSDLEIGGSAEAGWSLKIITTDSLSPGQLDYDWDPNTREVTVTDGSTTDVVLTGVKAFGVSSEVAGPNISRVTFSWLLDVDAGEEAGKVAVNEELSLSGSTWVQRFAPLN